MFSDIMTAATAAGDCREIVQFEHWFFRKVGGLRFQADEFTGQPKVIVPFMRTEACLSFPAVMKEFDIGAETADGQMLARVAAGLRYVKGLYPGDPLPAEIITGEASWTVEPHHIRIARQRVAMGLIRLVSGDTPAVNDRVELLRLADDPVVRKKVNAAFAIAAERLGMAADRKEEVIGFVDRLVHELAYIEALHERLDDIDRMRQKIQLTRRKYSREPLLREVVDQVARLVERATRQYSAVFDEIAAHTCEIMTMLRNLAEEIRSIRAYRDDLRVRFLAWDDLLEKWMEIRVECSLRVTELIQATHRFLAPRFMTAVDWLELARRERGTVTLKAVAWN